LLSTAREKGRLNSSGFQGHRISPALFLHARAHRRLHLALISSKVVNITTLEGRVEKSVSAADANRKFSELLRGVRKGRSYVVTSHGEPVAKLVPTGNDARTAAAARGILLSRLRKQRPATGASNRKRWTREELYERMLGESGTGH
jgi:prevent-host-death family protein